MILWRPCSWNPQARNAEPPPLWTRKPSSLEEELELPEAPEAAASLPEHLETPEPAEPTEQINALGFSAPPSPTPKPSCHPSQ